MLSIKELKDLIKNLPDDMLVVDEYNSRIIKESCRVENMIDPLTDEIIDAFIVSSKA